MTTPSSSFRIYTHMGWRIMLDLISRGSFFIINVLIARSLGVSEFGKLGYALSLVQMFYIVTDAGTHIQLIKELGENRSKNPGIWRDFFELKIVLIGLCAVLYLILGPFFWRWNDPWLFVMALVWMFSNSMLDFNQFVCSGLGRLDTAGRQLMIQRTSTIVGALVPILFFPSLRSIVTGLGLGGLVGSALSGIYLYRTLSIQGLYALHVPEWKRIFRVSIPNGIANAFGSWYPRVGFLVLGWYGTSLGLGNYSAAFRILEITYVIPAAVMTVSVPHLSEAFQKGISHFQTDLSRVAVVMGGAGLLWALTVYFSAPLLLGVIFGADYLEGLSILRIFAFVGGMIFLNYFVTHLMVVFNLQRRHAVHQILVFAVSCLLYLALVPRLQVTGAAIAFLISEANLFVLTAVALWQAWNRATEPTVCA